MRKLRSIFFTIIAIMFTCIVCSCSSECSFEYVNENGEKEVYKVIQTEDDEQVAEMFYNFQKMDKPKKEYKTCSIKGDLNLSGKTQNNKISMKGSLELEAGEDGAYLNINGKYLANVKTENSIIDSETELKFTGYLDGGYSYNSIYLKQPSSTLDMKVKISVASLLEQVKNYLPLDELTFSDQEDMSLIEIKELVKKLGIKISKTTGNTITCTYTFNANELIGQLGVGAFDACFTGEFVLDVQLQEITKISLDGQEVIKEILRETGEDITASKFTVSLSLKYSNKAIKKLSDAEKEQYRTMNLGDILKL